MMPSASISVTTPTPSAGRAAQLWLHLWKAFEELKRKVKPEIDWLYETRCDRCGGKAITAYTGHSQLFQCPRCLEKVPLFDCVEVEGTTAKGKPKKITAGPLRNDDGIAEEW